MDARVKKKNSLGKAWFILSPFFIYMIVKNVTSLLLLVVIRHIQQKEAIVNILPILEQHNLCMAVINGIASIIGVSVLYRRFLDETTFRGEYDPDANVLKQTFMRLQTSISVHRKKWKSFIVLPFFAGCSAITLNMIMTILPIASEDYEHVSNIQYSVPIWLGMILYGVIAPIVEEIVFRGLMYQRMKRHFSFIISMLVTSLMFGAFHGNIVQMIYAMILGILMILLYERLSSFLAPVLFHMSANCVIFICSTVFYGRIPVNGISCGAFLIATIGTGAIIYYFSEQ